MAEGVTGTWPEAGWLPTPLSIVTVSALLVDQVRVELCPGAMLAGEAVNEVTVGAVCVLTVTVALAVIVPPFPLAVRV